MRLVPSWTLSPHRLHSSTLTSLTKGMILIFQSKDCDLLKKTTVRFLLHYWVWTGTKTFSIRWGVLTFSSGWKANYPCRWSVWSSVISLGSGCFDFGVIIKNSVKTPLQNRARPTEELHSLPLVKMDLFDQVKRFAAQAQLESLCQRLNKKEKQEKAVWVLEINGCQSFLVA